MHSFRRTCIDEVDTERSHSDEREARQIAEGIGSPIRMTTKVEQRGYEDALSWLREHGFDLIEAPGTQGRVFLRKYNVSAAIQKDGDDGVKIFAYPGYLIGSEISKLVNRGYQQFLKTAKTEVPATRRPPESAAAIHRRIEGRPGAAQLYTTNRWAR